MRNIKQYVFSLVMILGLSTGAHAKCGDKAVQKLNEMVVGALQKYPVSQVSQDDVVALKKWYVEMRVYIQNKCVVEEGGVEAEQSWDDLLIRIGGVERSSGG